MNIILNVTQFITHLKIGHTAERNTCTASPTEIKGRQALFCKLSQCFQSHIILKFSPD